MPIDTDEANDIVEGLLPAFSNRLCDTDDEMVNQIAMTNALGWGLDTHEIQYADPVPDNDDEIRWSAIIYFTGEQEPDKILNGDRLIVNVSGVARRIEDDRWEIGDYKINDLDTNVEF